MESPSDNFVIPLAFKGVALRSGIKYRNLSKYSFSPGEKFWICSVIRGSKLDDFSKVASFSKICDRYKLQKVLVRKWLRLFNLGALDSIIDFIGCQIIYSSIVDEDSIDNIELMEIINNEILNTSTRRN